MNFSRIVAHAVVVLCATGLAAFAAKGQESPAGAAAARKSPGKRELALKPGKVAHPYQEDFAVLPVEKNSLKLDLAVLGEVDDKPGLPYVRERWHLEWRPGDPIDVYILKPRGVEKPPVVLYLYSYPQDTDRFKTDSWGGYATGNGFAAVGFVSALTGHRLERRPPAETFFTELPESIGGSVHDVQMILNYLATRKDLDLDRVGMFGQGSGGTIALLAAATDARIKAVDVLTPWGDWPTFIGKSSFIPSEDRLKINNPEFLAKMKPLDPLEWIARIKARSVRMQDVRKDGHMPDAAQANLEAAAPDFVEINQFGDAAALVPAAANGRLLEWIKASLEPDRKERAAADKAQRIHFYPARMPAGSPLGEPH